MKKPCRIHNAGWLPAVLAGLLLSAPAAGAGAWEIGKSRDADGVEKLVARLDAAKGRGSMSVTCRLRDKKISIFFHTGFLRMRPALGGVEYMFLGERSVKRRWRQDNKGVRMPQPEVVDFLARIGRHSRLVFNTVRHDYADVALEFALGPEAKALARVLKACAVGEARAEGPDIMPVAGAIMERVYGCIAATFGQSPDGLTVRTLVGESGAVETMEIVDGKTGLAFMLAQGAAKGAVRACAPYKLMPGLYDFAFVTPGGYNVRPAGIHLEEGR